jgi:monofunctional chorismate mutase
LYPLKRTGDRVRRDLERYRKKIDGIDRRVVRLLKRRFQLVRGIGALKREKGLAVAQPEREEEILRRVTEGVRGREIRGFLITVFRAVFSASRSAEEER